MNYTNQREGELVIDEVMCIVIELQLVATILGTP